MSEPVFGVDVERTREEIQRWAAEAEAKATRYQDMQQQVSAVSASAASQDGAVRVTVDTSGNMTELQISDDVRSWRGADIAGAVLRTVRQAQSKITDQVHEVMTATIGDDEDTVNAVLASYRQRFPAEDDGEDAAASKPPADDGDFSDDTYLS